MEAQMRVIKIALAAALAVGAGTEYGFTPNFSAKIEYR
jgi:opacity protein-like surface antigen